MHEHGSILLYIHGNSKGCYDRMPKDGHLDFTQLLSSEDSIVVNLIFDSIYILQARWCLPGTEDKLISNNFHPDQ